MPPAPVVPRARGHERRSRAALTLLGLVVAIEDIADADRLVAELREVTSGGLDRGVPEPGFDLLDSHALAGERRA